MFRKNKQKEKGRTRQKESALGEEALRSLVGLGRQTVGAGGGAFPVRPDKVTQSPALQTTAQMTEAISCGPFSNDKAS